MKKTFTQPTVQKIGVSRFEHVFAGKSGVNSNGNNGHFGSGNSNSNNGGAGHGDWENHHGNKK